MDSTKKIVRFLLRFFLQAKVHNVYFKTVPGFLDIKFASWPKVMKKVKFPPKKCVWFFHKKKNQGAVSIRKTVLPGMAIPMLKIRRPNGRLIFNMEIAIRR